MSAIVDVLRDFIVRTEREPLCPNGFNRGKVGQYVIEARRSPCNTYWSKITIERESPKQALEDAYTFANSFIDDNDARLLMRAAIKRVYDAANAA